MKNTDIITEHIRKTSVSNVQGEAFTLNAEGIERIMDVLTNLYSKVHLSVFREQVSNAVDAHILANNLETPIEITLPSLTNKFLTVQDYGTGMDLELINKVYRQYGASTKGQDKGQIGGFGLGAKSPLALTDEFYCHSVKDGRAISFHVTKIDGLPYLVIDKEEDTNERNGFRVTVPYGDYVLTEDEVKEITVALPIPVKVDGVLVEDNVYRDDNYISLQGIEGETLGWYKRDFNTISHSVNIVIGGVVYPISKNNSSVIPSITENLKKSLKYLAVPGMEVFLNIPISSIKLTPSREGIRFTEANIQKLENYLGEFVGIFKTHILSLLNSKATHKEAAAFWVKWGAMFDSKTLWRGKKVLTTFIPKDHQVQVTEFSRPRYSRSSSKKLDVRGIKLLENETPESNTCYVTYVTGEENPSEDYRKALTRIHAMGTTIGNYTNYRRIMLIPDSLKDNEWFSWWKMCGVTVSYEDFLTEVQETKKTKMREAREQKKRANAVGGSSFGTVKTKTDYKYKILTFDLEANKYGYKTISEDEVAKNDKVGFIEASNRPITIRELSLNSNYSNSPSEKNYNLSEDQPKKFILEEIFEEFKDYTIFVLNSRQRLDAFERMHPNAVNIVNKIIYKVTKEFEERNDFTWEESAQYSLWNAKKIMEDLKQYKKFVKTPGAEKNLLLEEILKMTQEKSVLTPRQKALYLTVVRQNVREKKYSAFFNSVTEKINTVPNFDFFLHNMKYPGWSNQISYINEIIKS